MADLTQDPRLHQAHHLYVHGRYHEAYPLFAALASEHPHQWGLRYSLGSCLIGLGQREQAIPHLMHAATLNPGAILPHIELTRAYSLLEKYDEARAAIDRALAIEPDNQTAQAYKADLLAVVGERDEAAAIAVRLLDQGVTAPAIANQIAPIAAKAGRADDAIELLRRCTPETAPNAPNVILCLFALGELLDKAGRYEEAWPVYERANAMARLPFDPDAHSATIDAAISDFTRDAISSLPRAGSGAANLVLIVGMPRSGTSLVEQILASHPSVEAGGERSTLPHIALSLMGGADASGMYLLTDPAPLRDVETINRLAETLSVSFPPAGRVAERFTDKTPGNWRCLALAQCLAPNTRVVWCRRDAMDNCLSCYFQHFYGPHPWCYDLASTARVYRDHERLMRHWQAVLDLPILEMSYEQLVEDQETQTRRLIDFVALPWDDACLRFHETTRVVRTRSNEQVRQPIYRSAIARWKQYEEHLEPLKHALECDRHDE
ncbi:MAG: sulfotransferase [Phycisphaerales bacterium]